MSNLRPDDHADSVERSWLRAWFKVCIDEYGLYEPVAEGEVSREDWTPDKSSSGQASVAISAEQSKGE